MSSETLACHCRCGQSHAGLYAADQLERLRAGFWLEHHGRGHGPASAAQAREARRQDARRQSA